jgi:hypothetical protein
MLKRVVLTSAWVLMLNTTGFANADDADVMVEKEMSGMSVLGNSEAPKSLVIVPWKTSEIGDGVGIANMLDGRAVPVDKDVFKREINFYELTRNASPSGVTALTNAPEEVAQQ